MNSAKSQKRMIRFFSRKNQTTIIVHSVIAKKYALELESDSGVLSYETNVPLLCENLGHVPRVDIRGSYFESEWTTDFYIMRENDKHSVREVITADMLEKKAIIERLELSRRYWSVFGVKDWKLVIVGKEG